VTTTLTPLSDEALVLGMQAGDERAFSQFFARWWPYAMTCAIWRVGRTPDAGEAEDIAAAVIARLIVRLARPGTAPPRHMRGYVAKAVAMTVISDARDACARRRALDGAFEQNTVVSQAALRSADGDPHAFADDPDERDANARALVDVARLEGTLRSDEMQLLAWRGEQMSYATIARWTGSTRTATVKRFGRLKQYCREVLGEPVTLRLVT
jgi:DNA-directed RNA polymerase specialized sigma24 family protein